MADLTISDPLNLVSPESAKDITPALRKRRMTIDAADVVQGVIKRVDDTIGERTMWLNKRMERYAKFRGWTQRESPPWEGSSNHHYPAMMANELRVEAGLFNAVTGIRPMMEPKVRRDLREAAETANGLIDHQLFVEGDGEQFVQKYIAQFCKDPCVFSFQPWVKYSSRLTDVRVLQQDDRPLIELMAEQIQALFPQVTELIAKNETGTHWTGTFLNEEGQTTDVDFTVWDKDEARLELMAVWDAVVFDGPVAIVDDLEDVVVPVRCENPQPVSPQNPKGAPWIARMSRITLDELRRGEKDGIYDLISPKDWKKLDTAAGGRVPTDGGDTDDAPKQQKDDAAGISPGGPHDYDRQWLTLIQWFGGWDVDDDALQEEVIFWVIKEAEVLIRAKHLTELYPGMPPKRPLSHTCYIPVEGQIYGISLLEVMEGLHDFLHVMLNQMTDNGDLANRPFGFYRASSGMKPETIHLWPGDLYPIDNPMQDVHFPTLPHADQTFGFNMVGLAKQFMDDVTQIGPIQRGQVPEGKASALRTLGTTMAILQQGAAMPEQVLRRLFMGLRQVWEQFHLLNGRFLKKRKQYLAAGQLEEHEDPYREIKDPLDIAVPIAWDWQPTLLNTNKGLVQQALQAIGMAVFNPLSFQVGTVGPEQYYNWQSDLIKSATLDPTRYIKKPLGVTSGPKITAEEAVLAIMENQVPNGMPLEDPREHLANLQKFMASDNFGFLTALQAGLFRAYLQRVAQFIQQQMQAQQLAAAAGEFSNTLGNSGEGQGSQPSAGELPGMQTEAPSQDELAGATQNQ